MLLAPFTCTLPADSLADPYELARRKSTFTSGIFLLISRARSSQVERQQSTTLVIIAACTVWVLAEVELQQGGLSAINNCIHAKATTTCKTALLPSTQNCGAVALHATLRGLQIGLQASNQVQLLAADNNRAAGACECACLASADLRQLQSPDVKMKAPLRTPIMATFLPL